MPNSKNIEKLTDIKAKVGKANSILFSDFKGVNSKDLTSFREEIRGKGGEVLVSKNTLLKKALIENNKLIINDYDLLSELSTFISKGTSYEAEYGKHDDLVMCLVLFAWMTNQNYFKDLLETDVRKNLMEEREKELEDDILPFFSDDGMGFEDEVHISAFDRELFF